MRELMPTLAERLEISKSRSVCCVRVKVHQVW